MTGTRSPAGDIANCIVITPRKAVIPVPGGHSEGVFLDCTDQGLTLRFLTGEGQLCCPLPTQWQKKPPSDADVAHVVQKISRRVIRKLRRLGYLEAGMRSQWPPGMIRPLRGRRSGNP